MYIIKRIQYSNLSEFHVYSYSQCRLMAALKKLLSIFTVIVLLTKSSFMINGQDQDQRPLLHDLLEKALTGNISNLFQLQRVYFNPTGENPGDIQLLANVTVDNIGNATPVSDCPAFKCTCDQNLMSSCCSSYFNFTLRLHPNEDDGTLQISDVVGVEGYDIFTVLDPSFSFLMGSIAIPQVQWLGVLFSDQSEGSKIELDLHISELESMPDYGELCDTLSMLLVWVRSLYIHQYAGS